MHNAHDDIPKTRSGREFSQFAPTVVGLATNASISAALERAVAIEDEQWQSSVSAPLQSPQPGSSPSSPRRGVSIQPIANIAADTAQNTSNRLRESPSLTPSADEPSENEGGGGSRKRKRPLTEARVKAKCARNKKLRATDDGKKAKRERRKRRRQDKPPTERQPKCNNAYGLPWGIPTTIVPLSHFPTVSTGYTGDKYVEDILYKEVWTLEKLRARGMEVFEWDGK